MPATPKVSAMSTSATIKLFLTRGDAKSLRTAEISNWSGKAVAAPRTELDDLLAREELEKSGVYILTGTDPDSGRPRAYIGEAEVIRERLKQHRAKEFWVSAIIFVSKDENLTKAHIRYLEGRLLSEAGRVGRFALENGQSSGSKLPESDREDMNVFLSRIQQLLPVLGSELLVPLAPPPASAASPSVPLVCRIKGARALGQPTPDGFVVFKGSTAVLQERPATAARQPYILRLRQSLVSDGALVESNGLYRFERDVEFSSPSAAASVIHGGGANGLTEWRTERGERGLAPAESVKKHTPSD
jgi:hypothetical protein